MIQQIAAADMALNNDYKLLLRTLPATQQQRLRIAERAWLAFMTKNEAAVAEANRMHANTATLVFRTRLVETSQRDEELRVMLGRLSASNAMVSISGAQADTELNKVYRLCMEKLSPDAERGLREAQRAWLDFRAKQVAVGPTQATAFPLVTIHRVASLRSIYLDGYQPPSLLNTPGEPLDPSIPDPFATAR